jgi:hypothetical protein
MIDYFTRNCCGVFEVRAGIGKLGQVDLFEVCASFGLALTRPCLLSPRLPGFHDESLLWW